MGTKLSQDQLVYEKALRGLPGLDPTVALKTILGLSGYKRQLFLVAEEDGLNRGVILNRFPPVPETLKEKLHANRQGTDAGRSPAEGSEEGPEG
jgi:hypothetical protein